MKVYLIKDVEKVGLAGEIIKVSDGFARNSLIPRKLGIEVTNDNENFFKKEKKLSKNDKKQLRPKLQY